MRAGGAAAALAAPPSPRRLFPGFKLQRVLVRGQPDAPGYHPRTGSAAPRARDPATREHAHPVAGRRPPLPRRGPLPHLARDRPFFSARRGSVRRLRPDAIPHGARGEVPARDRPSRPFPDGPARHLRPASPRTALPGPRVGPAPHARQADDDERGGLRRRVVRDRRAQGDAVGERDHRHLPGAAVAGHGVRPAAPLHGRDRRALPCVGIREGGDGGGGGGDRVGGARGGGGDPDGCAGRPGAGEGGAREWRGARERGRGACEGGLLQPRPAAHVPRSGRRGRASR